MAFSLVNGLISTSQSDPPSNHESKNETKSISKDELAVMGYLRKISKNKSIIPNDILSMVLKEFVRDRKVTSCVVGT